MYSGGCEQEVRMVNEKVLVSKHDKDAAPDRSYECERPYTSVVGYK